MAWTSDSAMLTVVRDALDLLGRGVVKSYRIGDRDLTRLDLAELRDWEKDLLKRTTGTTVRRGIALARIHRPS